MPTSTNSSSKVSFRRAALGICLSGLICTPVWAQLNNLRTTNSLETTLRSGRLLGSPTGGAGSSGGGSRASSLGFADSGAAAINPSGGRVGNLLMTGTRQMGSGRTVLMIPFGQSPSVTYYTRPVYTGRGGYSPPQMPGYTDASSAEIIIGDQRMLMLGSFHHRLYRPLEGGAIRDELTNKSLANPYDDEALDFSLPRKTHAERVADRMDAMLARFLERGWAKMREGKYWQCADDFENAVLINPDDLDGQVGRILSAAADKRFNTAVVYLRNLSRRRNDLFQAQRAFAETLHPQERGGNLLEYVGAMADRSLDDDGYAGLYVYLLWLDGNKSEAQIAADALRRNHRASPLAVFADRIREQLDPNRQSDPDLELRALSRAAR